MCEASRTCKEEAREARLVGSDAVKRFLDTSSERIDMDEDDDDDDEDEDEDKDASINTSRVPENKLPATDKSCRFFMAENTFGSVPLNMLWDTLKSDISDILPIAVGREEENRLFEMSNAISETSCPSSVGRDEPKLLRDKNRNFNFVSRPTSEGSEP